MRWRTTAPVSPASAIAWKRQWRASSSPDDLVFAGPFAAYLDASALYRRSKTALARAGLRNLRFHDLRHTFGTTAIRTASIPQVKEWMGHADVATTMRYLRYTPRPEDAQLIAEAFSSRTRMPSRQARAWVDAA